MGHENLEVEVELLLLLGEQYRFAKPPGLLSHW